MTAHSTGCTTRFTSNAAVRAGSRPNGGHHRQPERQECRERGVLDPPGYDDCEKIKDMKRHMLVDTQGSLMQAIVHAADIRDRDCGVLLMGSLFGLYPSLLKLYADSGYTRGRNSKTVWPASASRSTSRSLSDPMQAGSHSRHSAGSLSEPALGSTDGADWPKAKSG